MHKKGETKEKIKCLASQRHVEHCHSPWPEYVTASVMCGDHIALDSAITLYSHFKRREFGA